MKIMKGQATLRRLPKPEAARGVASAVARSEMLLGLGRLSEAREGAEAALRRDPAHVGALEVLAKALWQACEFPRLLKTIDLLIKLNPYEPGYFALKGGAYQALGRYGKAVEACARCLKAAPPGSNPDVAKALVELESWQRELIGDLLREDMDFRARYAQNPEAACRDRGFAFSSSGASADLWLRDKREELRLYPRPS